MSSSPKRYARSVFTVLLISIVAACSTYEVRTTDLQPVESLVIDIPEDLLLDVGIIVFEPDLQDIPSDEQVFVSVRESESIWVAHQLKTTLESSNAWGVVRIVPDEGVVLDLQVQGEITQSDGETLTLHLTTTDTSGRVWLEKEYQQVISRYSYDASQSGVEPFQGLYNQISNDLLALLKEQSLDYREDLRTISAMKFAQSFSPDAFTQYLSSDSQGYLQVDRLPAQNDPMLERVQDIQLRDQMFVDVLQDYYVGFTDQMNVPYREWRAQSYRETQIIRELEDAARARRIGGWLSILGGVAAAYSDDSVTRTGGSVAIYGGVEALRSSYQLRDEAALHIATLSEMGQSLETELEPSIIELQDRTITLTGTVRDQYEDWKDILREMYYRETGYIEPRPTEEQADTAL